MIELVAEIGINHNGNIDIAKKLIDVAHVAGCDFVKFQKRVVGLVYSDEELAKPRKSPWGITTRQQKEGLEFNISDYMEIDKYCRGKIPWFASVWDYKSLEFCAMAFPTPFIKIPSALMTDFEFIQKAVEYGKPLILSTGMCDEHMVKRAVDIIPPGVMLHALLHCTSTYPSAVWEQNLECIAEMRDHYPMWTKIGFSNHYPGLPFMLAAAALGAQMIEFHITLDRNSYGSDQASSLEPHAVFKLVKYIRGIEQAMGDGNKVIYDSERPIIEKLRRKING